MKAVPYKLANEAGPPVKCAPEDLGMLGTGGNGWTKETSVLQGHEGLALEASV